MLFNNSNKKFGITGRIPNDNQNTVGQIVSEKLSDVVKPHFIDEDSVPLLPEEQSFTAHVDQKELKDNLYLFKMTPVYLKRENMGNGRNLENAVSNVGVVFKYVCVNVYVVIVLSLVFTQNQESVSFCLALLGPILRIASLPLQCLMSKTHDM